jgi:hypothetical protein
MDNCTSVKKMRWRQSVSNSNVLSPKIGGMLFTDSKIQIYYRFEWAVF